MRSLAPIVLALVLVFPLTAHAYVFADVSIGDRVHQDGPNADSASTGDSFEFIGGATLSGAAHGSASSHSLSGYATARTDSSVFNGNFSYTVSAWDDVLRVDDPSIFQDPDNPYRYLFSPHIRGFLDGNAFAQFEMTLKVDGITVGGRSQDYNDFGIISDSFSIFVLAHYFAEDRVTLHISLLVEASTDNAFFGIADFSHTVELPPAILVDADGNPVASDAVLVGESGAIYTPVAAPEPSTLALLLVALLLCVVARRFKAAAASL